MRRSWLLVGTALLIAGVVAVVLLAADRDGPERRTLGRGAQSAVVLTPPGATGPLPVVVFLHGWRSLDTRDYDPWLEHLVAQGNAVIYPVFEPVAFSFPQRWLTNALAGVRTALAAIEVRPSSLVVAGHSAGGALAADYAAVAPSVGLPPARAVFAVYPGRRLPGFPGAIPAADLARIPPSTRILALAGAGDEAVGTEAARAIVAEAVRVPRSRRRFVLVTDEAVDDHRAPQRASEPARREFWARLDRLMAEARSPKRDSR
jgi:acetyl esterase/lipase